MNKKAKLLINILDMSHNDARKFFLKSESYCNFPLPKYFKFDTFLKNISEHMSKNHYEGNPKKYNDLNHTIFHNKDGKYSWRALKLINPVLYVELVHKMTEEKNWKDIVGRFRQFAKNPKIVCASLPIESYTKSSDKARQVNQWWTNVEQKSIELALEYEYLLKTDIEDCYGSIYSHSIAWALHGKEKIKDDLHSKKWDKNLVGNCIDDILCKISYGQTNGIPQGSSLTDYIAEMLLGYADILLTEKIEQDSNIKDYYILRYRDDYRIFTHSAIDADHIVRYLCEVLADLGLKLNIHKTIASNHIIQKAIKEDKWFHFTNKMDHKDLQKHLLIIYDFSGKYPNSGSLKKLLDKYYKLIKNKTKIIDCIQLISIIVNIAYNNPITYPTSVAILSKLLTCIENKNKKLDVIDKIKMKFKKIPNTEHLSLWLQRITFHIDPSYEYKEPLCKLAAGQDENIWNFKWLDDGMNRLLDVKTIIDYELISTLPPTIQHEEVALFEIYETSF